MDKLEALILRGAQNDSYSMDFQDVNNTDFDSIVGMEGHVLTLRHSVHYASLNADNLILCEKNKTPSWKKSNFFSYLKKKNLGELGVKVPRKTPKKVKR